MAKLYVVATPIGNLQDWSPRAAETLREADLIAAEDTRVTGKLCQIHGIRTPLTSCHQHNEDSKGEYLAEKMLAEDLTVALTTDAGTPCVSDPGYALVKACVERGIEVQPVPGCCAAIAALSVSGFDTREFAFFGFLPREKKDLREKLREIAERAVIAVVHESPFRVTELTEAILEELPEAELSVSCDLTKLHEKTLRGTPEQVLRELKENPKTEKGEYCLVLDLHRVPRPEKKQENAE
ncbi:MAG: 16S rRNA (cytidine(1402)-2'-O)-methyltransferase, partial [Clostridia bacterium]|nr:16S rRNA (cytidine(1402)-2'-O)-methyltransferase [Clostridia bacterium]